MKAAQAVLADAIKRRDQALKPIDDSSLEKLEASEKGSLQKFLGEMTLFNRSKDSLLDCPA